MDIRSLLVRTHLYGLALKARTAQNLLLGRYLALKDDLRAIGNPELRSLHRRLRDHLACQNAEWPHFKYASGYFYQSLDAVRISGFRPTERRFAAYGLSEFLGADSLVLDIGANAGFLSILMARRARQVDAVEWNPYQVAIGREVAAYLGVANIRFIESSFQEFRPDQKYDVVASFANHTTVDGGMAETDLRGYMERLHGMLNPSGTLLFESHPWDVRDPRFHGVMEGVGDIFECVRRQHFPSGRTGRGARLFFAFRKKDTAGQSG